MFLKEDGGAVRITDREVGRALDPCSRTVAGRVQDPLLELAGERRGGQPDRARPPAAERILVAVLSPITSLSPGPDRLGLDALD
jgi:hypothetical protein